MRAVPRPAREHDDGRAFGNVGPVRLVLRLPEHDLHGTEDLAARPILGDQKDALAGRDTLGDAPPERVGFLPRQRRHETYGVAALHAVDQDRGQVRDALPRLLHR
jgi:hypothetical protein